MDWVMDITVAGIFVLSFAFFWRFDQRRRRLGKSIPELPMQMLATVNIVVDVAYGIYALQQFRFWPDAEHALGDLVWRLVIAGGCALASALMTTVITEPLPEPTPSRR